MSSLVEVLQRGNPWWRDAGASLPPPAVPSYRRRPYASIRSRLLAQGTRGLLLTGLRRVGKTELARQIFQELLEDRAWPKTQLAYLRADDGVMRSEVTIADLLEAWTPFRDRERPAIVVIDEVHHLGGGHGSGGKPWHRQIKGLIDEGQFRMLATGSSAAVLQDGASEAPGRWGLEHLEPLSFLEFREMKAAGQGEPTPGSAPQDLLDYLLRGGFPETVFTSTAELAHEAHKVRIRQVLDLEITESRRTDKLEALYRILVEQSGDAVDAQNLNRALGTTRPTLESWIDQLERAFLVRRLRPRESTTLHERRKAAKVYGPDPGIVAAYSRSMDPARDAELLGRLRETAVLRHLHECAHAAKFELHVLQRARGSGTTSETDFVLTGGREAFLVEVASASDLQKKRHTAADHASDLRDAGRFEAVHAVVVQARPTPAVGPIPLVGLAEFLERISLRHGQDPLAELRRLSARIEA